MFGADWESNNPAPQVYYQNRLPRPIKPRNPGNYIKKGIIPNSIHHLFQSTQGKPLTFYCSFLQIYNEKIFDLLQNPTRDKPLTIREDQENGIFVENLAEYIVEKAEDCIYLLKQGDKNRVVRQTKFNHHSSRSHTIFQLLIEGDKANKRGALKKAKMNLCDLAGSEKFDKEGRMIKDHIQEMNNINKSLTTLGKVISALGGNAAGHIPYRESKLTRLLQDSLAVNTRTILIATVSPAISYVEETINTLKFADRAKQVMVVVKKNEISATNDLLVSKLQREIQHLKSLLNLNRKGGLQDISQQLLALKEENERLKKITKNLTIEEVETLKQENKKLRLELQNMKGETTDDSFFVTESKPSSSTKSTKLPSAREVLSSIDPGSNIQSTLEMWKKKELEQAVQSMKSKIILEGRCPICTLKVPCDHFKEIEDIPRPVTPVRNVSLPPYPKKSIMENPSKDPDIRTTSFESSKKLSYRFRMKNSYNEESAALNEYKEEEKRRQKLKETENKLIKLSKIEAYREEKIRKEMQKLEEERQKEEEEAFREQVREMNRKKYLDQQKKKLEEFQRNSEQEIRELKVKMKKEIEEKKKAEKKKMIYLEEQKKKLIDYHTKKKMIEQVTMDQIDDLAKEVLTKKRPLGSTELI
jgi:Kinesin motor domain